MYYMKYSRVVNLCYMDAMYRYLYGIDIVASYTL